MSAPRTLTILLALMLLAGPLAGCLRGGDEPVDKSEEQKKAEELLGETGQQKIEDVAALIPKNYSFPLQQKLPSVTVSIPGTVSSEALGSVEAERDEGGMEYRTVFQMQDVSQHIPPGQPTEMFIKLFWDGAEVNSADLDIAVNVPGYASSHSSTSETFNWNYAVKSLTVNTVGVPGLPHEVGIQAAGGAATQGFDYTLEIQFTYVKDVLTPYHPWAFQVPEGASGIILESEAAAGDEHIVSEFVIIDPQDNLLEYKAFNDIDIPTQSVFIPTNGKGTYVFYAYHMYGGFLRLKADVPLEVFEATPLDLVETTTVDVSAPAPGVAGKDPLEGTAAGGTAPASDTGATAVSFDTGGTFPLRVTGFIDGQVHGMSKIVLKSPLGVVHELVKIGRYEDEQGSIGYTGDTEGSSNNRITWANMQKGAWTAEIVNDGPSTIGHTIVTYQR